MTVDNKGGRKMNDVDKEANKLLLINYNHGALFGFQNSWGCLQSSVTSIPGLRLQLVTSMSTMQACCTHTDMQAKDLHT